MIQISKIEFVNEDKISSLKVVTNRVGEKVLELCVGRDILVVSSDYVDSFLSRFSGEDDIDVSEEEINNVQYMNKGYVGGEVY